MSRVESSLKRPLALSLAAALAFTAAAAFAGDADARSRERHRSSSYNGPHVQSSRHAHIYRSPTHASVTRHGQINGRSWSSSRVRDSASTDDGYISTTTLVGPRGESRTRSRDVSWGDGYYSRSTSSDGSNGRGYDRDVTVVDTGDAYVVTRDLTTNNGVSRSRTVTRPY